MRYHVKTPMAVPRFEIPCQQFNHFWDYYDPHPNDYRNTLKVFPISCRLFFVNTTKKEWFLTHPACYASYTIDRESTMIINAQSCGVMVERNGVWDWWLPLEQHKRS